MPSVSTPASQTVLDDPDTTGLNAWMLGLTRRLYSHTYRDGIGYL